MVENQGIHFIFILCKCVQTHARVSGEIKTAINVRMISGSVVTSHSTLQIIMIQPFPVLTTERLLLRQFTDNDLENVFKGLSHPDIIKYYGVSYDSLEAAKAQMVFFADLEKNETGIWWAVCSRDNSVFYGAGGLNSRSKEHRKAEIGFWLLTGHWGKGIMTEAMPLIWNYGFDHLGLHRIEGIVESENIACKKAVEKLQFEYEGTMKECEIKNGRFISLDIYAKFKQEEGEGGGVESRIG
jgi:[ribosomal protein S5]-alanine N-acetyltransferase